MEVKMMKIFWVLTLFMGNFGAGGQITTLGTGHVNLVPDQVHFYISIRVDDNDAGRALSRADSRVQAVIDGFIGLGVTEEQIQTLSLNVYPTKDYRDGEVIRRYYIAEHRLQVTANDLALIGAGFQLVNGIEGENTVSIQLDSTRRAVGEERALAGAILDARKKAGIMASTENLEIGRVLHMTNTYASTPQFSYGDSYAPDSVGNSVMPGQIVISANATVVYEISGNMTEVE